MTHMTRSKVIEPRQRGMTDYLRPLLCRIFPPLDDPSTRLDRKVEQLRALTELRPHQTSAR